MLDACNNYAQSRATKRQFEARSFGSKKVFATSIPQSTNEETDGRDKRIADLESKIKRLEHEKFGKQNKFWCKFCIPNKLKREDCKHCWRHSDISKGINRVDCQQCKYWNTKKIQTEKAAEKEAQKDQD